MAHTVQTLSDEHEVQKGMLQAMQKLLFVMLSTLSIYPSWQTQML